MGKLAVIYVETGIIARHGRKAFVYEDSKYLAREAHNKARVMNSVRGKTVFEVRPVTDEQIAAGRLFDVNQRKNIHGLPITS
jgi:hypothetical protein